MLSWQLVSQNIAIGQTIIKGPPDEISSQVMPLLENLDLFSQNNENCDSLKAQYRLFYPNKIFSKFARPQSASFVAVMTNCTIRKEELKSTKKEK